jgi:hypothetical protein
MTNIHNALLKQSKTELYQLLKDLKDPIDELRQPIDTDERLKKNKELLDKIENNKTALQAKIAPIKQKFLYLQSDEISERFSAELTEEEKDHLNKLDDAWRFFENNLKEVRDMIKTKFNEMKTQAEGQLDDFKKEIMELRDSFTREAPKDKNIQNADAQAKIREFTELCEKKRDQEEQYKFKEDIFGIDHIEYKELASVEKENAVLKQLWDIKEKWDDMKRVWYP